MEIRLETDAARTLTINRLKIRYCSDDTSEAKDKEQRATVHICEEPVEN